MNAELKEKRDAMERILTAVRIPVSVGRDGFHSVPNISLRYLVNRKVTVETKDLANEQHKQMSELIFSIIQITNS